MSNLITGLDTKKTRKPVSISKNVKHKNWVGLIVRINNDLSHLLYIFLEHLIIQNRVELQKKKSKIVTCAIDVILKDSKAATESFIISLTKRSGIN